MCTQVTRVAYVELCWRSLSSNTRYFDHKNLPYISIIKTFTLFGVRDINSHGLQQQSGESRDAVTDETANQPRASGPAFRSQYVRSTEKKKTYYFGLCHTCVKYEVKEAFEPLFAQNVNIKSHIKVWLGESL